jgi:hypothetical protein
MYCFLYVICGHVHVLLRKETKFIIIHIRSAVFFFIIYIRVLIIFNHIVLIFSRGVSNCAYKKNEVIKVLLIIEERHT